MWKTLRINMSSATITEEDFKTEYRGIGGRGLVARVAVEELNPRCDPLGPDNKLILATTAFAGMGVSGANRLSVGCKSPLTGGLRESNSGGTFATYMINHGIKLMIIEGQPREDALWLLHIDAAGKASLKEARDLEGLNNYELVETLMARYGDVAIASIGCAGERKYKNSSIQVTEFGTNYPNRAAARGGVGAVMGAKRLKAVVIEKAAKRIAPEYAAKDTFYALRKELNKIISTEAATHELRLQGTPAAVRLHYEAGILPVRNFSGGDLEEIDKIYPDKHMELIKSRGKSGHPCQAGCMARCSSLLYDRNGNYLTGGLEYETVALCGANTAIADFDLIARIDRICDDLGLDTIETGATLGVCMDAGKIPWGDGEAALKLLQEMADGTEFGRLLGEGTEAAGKYLGVKRIPVAKHMAIPGYDIRGAAPTGVAFGGGPQAADHTACPSTGTYEGVPPEEICKVSYTIQREFATLDNLTCIFSAIFLGPRIEKLAGLYAAAYGGEASMERLLELGAATIRLEKQFNRAAGWTEKDDRLPEFFYTEKSAMTGTTFNVPPEYLSKAVEL